MKKLVLLLFILAQVVAALNTVDVPKTQGYAASCLVRATDTLKKAFSSSYKIYPREDEIWYKDDFKEIDLGSLIYGSDTYLSYLDNVNILFRENVKFFDPNLTNTAAYMKLAMNYISMIYDYDKSPSRHLTTIYFYDQVVTTYGKFFDMDNSTKLRDINRSVNKTAEEMPLLMDLSTLDDEPIYVTPEQAKLIEDEIDFWMKPLMMVETTTTTTSTTKTTTTTTSTTLEPTETDDPTIPDIPDFPFLKKRQAGEIEFSTPVAKALLKYKELAGVGQLGIRVSQVNGGKALGPFLRYAADNKAATAITTTAAIGVGLCMAVVVPYSAIPAAVGAFVSGTTGTLAFNEDHKGKTYAVEAKTQTNDIEVIMKACGVDTGKVGDSDSNKMFKNLRAAPLSKLQNYLSQKNLLGGSSSSIEENMATMITKVAEKEADNLDKFNGDNFNNVANSINRFFEGSYDGEIAMFNNAVFENHLKDKINKSTKLKKSEEAKKAVNSFTAESQFERALNDVCDKAGVDRIEFTDNADDNAGQIRKLFDSPQFKGALDTKPKDMEPALRKLMIASTRGIQQQGNEVVVDSVVAETFDKLDNVYSQRFSQKLRLYRKNIRTVRQNSKTNNGVIGKKPR